MALRFDLAATTSAALNAPRSGRLVLDRAPLEAAQDRPATAPPIVLETPNFFKYTRRGLQPHLVREVAAEVGSLPDATRVQIEDFLESDFPDCGKYSGGLHRFIALDRSDMLLLDTLDPVVATRAAKSTNKYMGIDSEGGIRRLTPETFAQLVSTLRPDIYIPLADYIEEPLPSLTQGKRIAKSVDRSTRWLDECLERITFPAAVFAPVMGSHSPELRDKCAQSLAARNNIDGYAFNDVCLSLPFEQKLALAQRSLGHLDASKPRYMLGVSSPDHVVRAILGGIDLFDSSYPYAVTEQGFASTYLLNGQAGSSPRSVSDSGHLDLWQESMFGDFEPLVKGCECFTCRNHHRSYIHHLLMTKEMLATVLLQIHNMHWYQRFFADVRCSMASGTLESDAARFLECYGCLSSQPATAPSLKRAFNELDKLASQTCSPTTKIQRKRYGELPAAPTNAA
ncbi:tRNA-guanine transglycosylase [Martensiomyces pterosporus]|nr:tRNA-guanine transglycosylase [Martensiomyces pterosporus]